MPKLTLPRLAGCLLLLSVFVFCPLGVHAQTVTTFEGIDASQLAKPQFDFDPNGSVGAKQYMEWVDPYYQAWSKTSPFTKVWTAPQNGDTPFVNAGLTQCSTIQGDGIVTYDRLASRWIIAAHNQLSLTITSYYYCVAVSSGDDLTTATWYTYAFNLDSWLGSNAEGNLYFPDWPKFGTWTDAYYVGMDVQDTNDGFLEVGVIACALDRADMLIGATALAPQCFKVPGTTTDTLDLEHSLQPADVEGTTPPPTGTPEYFVSIQNPVNDGVTTTSTSFNLWTFSVNWSNPAATTFTQASVTAPTYTPGCYQAKSPGNTVCVPEPTTSASDNYIDSVGDRFMYRFSYRNFGSYQSYLASHTVQVGSAAGSQTGVRWYELRDDGNGAPTIFQSGTVSPDTTNYRFMPSLTQDQNGNAAVGYSISSASMHPGMSASYWNLNAQNTPTEISLYAGSADQENTYKWGDYTDMTVDPANGCTFWYANEYFTSNQTGTGKPIWQTRVSNFTLPSCGTVAAQPTSLSFGSEAVGTSSNSLQVVLNNGASTALTIDSIFGSGADPGDFQESDDCGSSVAPGAACIVTMTFTPKATGSRTATLNISDSAGNSPQTVSLTGTGTSSVGTLTFSPASVSFGSVPAGNTASTSITVNNTGNATTTFTSIGLTGANAASFGESNNCTPSLAAGGSCSISVSFSPSATGTYGAAVTLTDNATGSPQSVALSGTGVLPVTFSVSSLNFATVLVGSSKTSPAVTLTNQMNVALTGISIAASGTGYTQTNTCGTSIAAGAKCTITVKFAPTAPGTSTGSVTITDSAVTSPQTISLTGVGQAPVGVNPTSDAFGSVAVGSSSAAKTITVSNNLKTALTIDSIAFGGPDPGDYSQTNTCGSSMASDTKCTISVTFSPQATGSRAANLVITDSAGTSPQKVKLSGTGTD